MNFKRILKSILIIIGIIVLGFLLLGLAGEFLVKEIVQDIKISKKISEPDKELSEGIYPAPDFELLDLNGKKVKLNEFLGEPFILTFWATWNPATADQIKIFDDYLAKNKENLFKILAINSQENKSVVTNFLKRGGYQIKVLLDEKGIAGELYKARNLPITYFIDKKGVIQWTTIGILSEQALIDKSVKIIK